jgi:hypothetical protein
VVTICTSRFNIHQSYVLATQCIYVFCVDLILYSIIWLVCITETECVYFAVRDQSDVIRLILLSNGPAVLRRSVAGLSLRQLAFVPLSVHVRSTVDTVTL